MSVVDFKTTGYFSWSIRFLGIILVFVGVLVATVNRVAGPVILLISLVIFTTHYRVRVDFDKKIYRDYIWILGLKSGKPLNFENIEYLFIKKSTTSQKLNSMTISSTIRKEVYDGYLKFSETDKIHLMTSDKKKVLVDKLRRISKLLQVKIMDYSETVPTVI